MSNRNEVAVLYRLVIEDVIRNIRREFVNMGVDEQVLHELQTGWERRLLESGIFNVAPANTSSAVSGIAGGVMRGGVPGSAAAAMYYYSQQQQQQQQQPLVSLHPTGQNQGAGLEALITAASADNNTNVTTNISAVGASSRPKRHEDSDPDALNSDLDSSSSEGEPVIRRSASSQDQSSSSSHKNSNNNNSNTGDADSEEGGANLKENILLCLYEKVHRTRNKWRCVFKEGILHLDGQEYCLNKINGEFEW